MIKPIVKLLPGEFITTDGKIEHISTVIDDLNHCDIELDMVRVVAKWFISDPVILAAINETVDTRIDDILNGKLN